MSEKGWKTVAPRPVKPQVDRATKRQEKAEKKAREDERKMRESADGAVKLAKPHRGAPVMRKEVAEALQDVKKVDEELKEAQVELADATRLAKEKPVVLCLCTCLEDYYEARQDAMERYGYIQEDKSIAENRLAEARRRQIEAEKRLSDELKKGH